MKIVSWRAAAAAVAAGVVALGTAGIGAGAAASAAPAAPAPGTPLWSSRPSTPEGISEAGAALAVSPGGGTVFTTATTAPTGSGIGDGGIFTVAYRAATGRTLWARHYGGTHNSFDRVTAMAVSPAGTRVFVTGSIAATEGGSDSFLTVAYNAATGAQLWAVRGSGGSARSVTVGPGGQNVYVTGDGFAVSAYAAATGARRWASHFAIPGVSDLGAASVTAGPGGGRVYATGEANGDFITVAFSSASGAPVWHSRFPGEDGRDPGGAVGVAVGPGGGRVYVTGTAAGPAGAPDGYATVAYNAATGAQLWAEDFNADPASGSSRASAIAVTPGGGKVLVTGASGGFGTVAYDAATGRQLWTAQLPDGTGPGFATAMAVSRDGNSVFVAGPTSPAPRVTDLTVVAYATATGAREWDNTSTPQPIGTPTAIGAGLGAVFVVSDSFATDAYTG